MGLPRLRTWQGKLYKGIIFGTISDIKTPGLARGDSSAEKQTVSAHKKAVISITNEITAFFHLKYKNQLSFLRINITENIIEAANTRSCLKNIKNCTTLTK